MGVVVFTLKRKPAEASRITVGDLEVSVLRKPVRHLRLAVYPPYGSVRIAAPLSISDEAIRELVASRLDWIRRQQARFAGQRRESGQELVSGESHYYLGQPHVLQVVERKGVPRVALPGADVIALYVRPGTSTEGRSRVLERWYRQRLQERIPPLLAHWQPVLGVQAAEWGIRKMRTRWGSCNIRARRIWLSLELARKPGECLEYVVVHELLHLLERGHNQRFYGFLDQFLPSWRLARAALNPGPPGPAAA
jgi:predicted metal-dependent hydrolase